MRVATWNVNSIRARQERLLAWLARHEPDVLCLQETKVEDAAFPFEPLRAAGYYAVAHGQRTYNGVAILAREEPREVEAGLGDGGDDAQARLLSARVAGLRVLSVYVPNGDTVGSEKWRYKLEWLRRLRARLDAHHTAGEPLLLCGDLNVARDEGDVAHPDRWAESVLFHPVAREALEGVRAFGLVDVFRQIHPEGGIYSWWDYRMLAFPKNDGLRIDHLLATQGLAARCTDARVDRDERKGKGASDHAPVTASFAWP